MNYIKIDLGITNTYLLHLKNGYMLIDTGYSSNYDSFVKGLKKNNIDISQIKYLFITHYHDDHAGFAAKLKEEFNIHLIVQKTSVILLSKGDSDGQEIEFPITKRVGFIFGLFSKFHNDFKYPPVIINEEDIIIDGDDKNILRSLGIPADIIFTPGHTCDSMSILCDDGVAFVGDACMNFLKFLGANYRPIYYTSLEKMYSSIERLISLGAKTIVPAHGKEYDVSRLIHMLRKKRSRIK